MTRNRTTGVAVVLGALLLSTGACNEFLTVENPNVVNADALDPVKDATTLSLSARENFYYAAGQMALYSSFPVWETWPAETFPEVNQFGLRDVVVTNSPLNTTLWSPLSIALTSNEKVLEVLTGTPGEDANINVARSALFSGYSLVVMAEDFCQSVVRGGPPLSSAAALDVAIARFTRAIPVARAITSGADAAEAGSIVNAAYVGRARAALQAGKKGPAAADAALVAPGFTLNIIYADNPASRTRISNRWWLSTNDRRVAVIPPYWRVNDPRVSWLPPATGAFAADGITPFFAQNKFPGYDAPMRLASRIEADYIAAEATGSQAMLVLIQARRAANAQPAYAGPTDDASVLAELEDQRGREFFLEGKRLGDFRRNGAAVRGVPASGSEYFKSGYSAVGSQVCFPVPFVETSNNPNFPKG